MSAAITFYYKLLLPAEWEQFQKDKEFHGTTMDIRDGYIHMSETTEQMIRVKEKYYKDTKMYLVKIDPKKLSNLKYEPASNGDLYPHEYGILRLDSVLSAELLEA